MNIKKLKVCGLIAVFSIAMVGCTTVKGGPDQDGSDGSGSQHAGSQVQTYGVDSGDNYNGENYAYGDSSGSYGDVASQDATYHFKFDSSSVQPQDEKNIQQQAAYLRANPNAKLVIQGYTDARGTDSYNLALGERRAKAVKQMMVINGAQPDQISVISFGKEKPVALGTTQAAYAENRRAVIIHQHG